MEQLMPQGQPMPAPPVGEPSPVAMDAPAFGEAVQASPEEQAQLEHFVAKAYELTYDDAMLPKVLDMLGGEGDPMEGLARASALVITRVMGAAEQAGEKLSGDVLLHAGAEVFEDLANLATKAGIHDFENDPDALEGAFFRTLDTLRGMLQESGKIDQAAAAKDMEALAAADQDGRLEGMFRNLAKSEGGEEAPAEPPAQGGLMEGMN